MSRNPIVFLMYHELELPGRALCRRDPGYARYVLRASEFEKQIEYLKANGYRGLNVTEATTFPEGKNVAITFDDGSETDLIAAASVLRQAGFSATFFLTVSWLDHPGHLSTSQVRELAAQGFEIGCHSMTHAYLDALKDEDLRREIAGAKTELEQLTGVPVHHFSCPGGRYDDRAMRIAREAGYCTVSTSRIQANFADSDRFALGRVAILRDLPLSTFAGICDGRALSGMRAQGRLLNAAKQILGNSVYDRVRQVLLGNRYQ